MRVIVRQRKKNWARLIAKTWLEDPEVCPKCGAKMRVVAAISSPVIERILRHRGEWDSPWKRERRARGPPRQLEIVPTTDEEFSQLGPAGEDDFSQVSPSGDDDV